MVAPIMKMYVNTTYQYDVDEYYKENVLPSKQLQVICQVLTKLQ